MDKNLTLSGQISDIEKRIIFSAYKREDKRWVIHTNSQNSMQPIKHNKENHPIFNQMYGIVAELQNPGKQIILCKVPAHTGIKGNEKADRAAKQAIDIPEMTTRLPYTEYFLTIRKFLMSIS